MEKNRLFDFSKNLADCQISSMVLALRKLKVSDSEFSQIAHIDKGNLSKIFSGVIYPNFKTWCRLLVALDSLIESDSAVRRSFVGSLLSCFDVVSFVGGTNNISNNND